MRLQIALLVYLFAPCFAAHLREVPRNLETDKSRCRGRIVRRRIDMEVDGEQQRLIYGDSVQDLPNLKVIAKRTRRSVVPPTANDAIVTNYGSDGKVLIIGDGNEFATGANPKGGFIKFDFGRKVHQLISIRILEAGKGSFVRRPGKRQFVEPGISRVALRQWFRIRRFRLKLTSKAYVAAIEYSLCIRDRTLPKFPTTTNKPKAPVTTTSEPNQTTTTKQVLRTTSTTTKTTTTKASTTSASTSTTTRANPYVKTRTSNIPITVDATYECEFTNLWSKESHPLDYPSAQFAHWSNPVVATHDSSYTMWKTGTLATLGTQMVAEAGITSGIEREAAAAGFGEVAVGSVQFNTRRSRQVVGSVVATSTRNLISSLTMMAPTPDWVSGLSSFDLRDKGTNTWYSRIEIETFPYDGGSADDIGRRTKPQVPVFRIKLNPSGRDLPVSRWTCVLQP